LVFGDSSVGEWFWDGACLLVGSIFSYAVTCRSAGFRAGVVAAALSLATFVLGTPQYLLGRGLGEISSAGLIFAAALLALHSRDRSVGWAIASGIFAVLGFYTRLNNLMMAAGVTLFALLPERLPLSAALQPKVVWRRLSLRRAAVIAGVL